MREKRYFCVPFTTEGFNYFEFNALITVTKADVIAEISSKTGIDKKDVSETLENLEPRIEAARNALLTP